MQILRPVLLQHGKGRDQPEYATTAKSLDIGNENILLSLRLKVLSAVIRLIRTTLMVPPLYNFATLTTDTSTTKIPTDLNAHIKQVVDEQMQQMFLIS